MSKRPAPADPATCLLNFMGVSRTAIRSLASSLGLAKDTVARAVRRLSDLGVIEAVQVRASCGVFEAGSYRLAVPARFVSVACPSQPPAGSLEFALVGPPLVRSALA